SKFKKYRSKKYLLFWIYIFRPILVCKIIQVGIISSSNQIQFQDLASPNYSLEFESEKQMDFLIQIIKSKRKKKNNLLIENIARNIAGEYIKRSIYNFR
ncbi:MAG: hypothetical protein EAZ53_00830, partial [Bacteroidetes bacterium]